jgi:hypothetical protein
MLYTLGSPEHAVVSETYMHHMLLSYQCGALPKSESALDCRQLSPLAGGYFHYVTIHM